MRLACECYSAKTFAGCVHVTLPFVVVLTRSRERPQPDIQVSMQVLAASVNQQPPPEVSGSTRLAVAWSDMKNLVNPLRPGKARNRRPLVALVTE